MLSTFAVVKFDLSISFIAIVLAIFTHAIGVTTHSALGSQDWNIPSTSDESLHSIAHAQDLIYPPLTENTFFNGRTINNSRLYTAQWGVWALVDSADQAAKIAFAHCEFLWSILLWSTRISDLIFPFHTFW